MKKLEHITLEQWQNVCKKNRTLLEDFINNSIELSPKTKKSYESNLKIWFVWVMENLGNKPQTEIKPLEYKRFQNWLVNRGCSSADVNNKRAAVSSINGYIEVYYHDEYPMFRNFINKSIKRPEKSFTYEKEPLTKEEFQNLVAKLDEMKEWQKKAYILFTFETGCRREESRQLTKDVINASPIIKYKTVVDEQGNSSAKEVKYYKTKPIRCKGRSSVGKVRSLTFGEEAMNALKKWVEERGEDDCPYMFVSNYGGDVRQVSETTFNNWAKTVFEPIVGRRFTPHSIRRSRATQAIMEDGVDINSVKHLLGHESAETTRIYVINHDEEDVDDLF